MFGAEEARLAVVRWASGRTASDQLCLAHASTKGCRPPCPVVAGAPSTSTYSCWPPLSP